MAKKTVSSAKADGSEKKVTPEVGVQDTGATGIGATEGGTPEGSPVSDTGSAVEGDTPVVPESAAPDAVADVVAQETPAPATDPVDPPASEPVAQDDPVPAPAERTLTLPDDPGISAPERREPEPDADPVAQQPAAEAPMDPVPPSGEPHTPHTVVERRGGFVPVLAGGIVAAGLGFGLALYLDSAGIAPFGGDDEAVVALNERIDAQQRVIDDLHAALEVGPDLTGIETAATQAQDTANGLSDRLAALEGQVGGYTDRITELEKRPISEGVSETAIQAYEAELARLQQAMVDQRAEVEALITQAQQKEAAAAEDAQTAARRAGISQVLSAIDNGTPYANVLQGLAGTGVTIAPELQAPAQDGVPTLGALIDSFPDAARTALESARLASGEGTSSIGEFLKTQLGARSLTPREGGDTDAVLSRAEAALRDGRLQDTLAELATLPAPAQEAMADWTARATTRAQALAAAEALLAAQTQSQ